MTQAEEILIDIESYRPAGATAWDLPSWGHPLSQSIMPFCARVDDRLIPIGTAFFIGHSPAFIMSAEHNLRDALQYERFGDDRRRTPYLPHHSALKDVNLVVLHHRLLDNGRVEVTIWPTGQLDIPRPTDLLICSQQEQDELPYILFPLSFAIPRVGSHVRSFGYCGFTFPEGGIPIDSIHDDSFDWHSQYNHRFRVVEGTVRRLFPRGFLSSFVPGACFTIDAVIEHAMSGGPVLTENGAICGVNTSGAGLYSKEPASLISLLYPSLAILPSLSGTFLTDGSEARIVRTPTKDGLTRFDVPIAVEDRKFVYSDGHDYERQEMLDAEKGL